MTYQDSVPAAERALQILEIITANHNGLTAAQISNRLDIPRSAVYALLNTLRRLGYIQQEGTRTPYMPGSRLWSLGRSYSPGTGALIKAFQSETEKPDGQDATYALAILSGLDVVILAETPAKHQVRCVIPPGHREKAINHPAGMVMLAGSQRVEGEQNFVPLTHEFLEKLDYIRQHAVIKKTCSDAITWAAPICLDGHHPEAAVLLCCPTFRFSSKHAEYLATEVREMASRISHRLGASTYHPYTGIGAQSIRESVEMTHLELNSFLEGPWAARLACIRPDGTPHIVPIWYEWDHATFTIVAWPDSVWATLVEANPSVALSIDEPWPPMRRVMVRGIAEYVPPDEISGGIQKLRQRISTRYLGKQMPREDMISDADRWTTFRIVPVHTIAMKQKLS